MKSSHKSFWIKLIGFVLLCSYAAAFIFPSPVHARNIFKQIGRGLRRTVRFVVRLPNKTTRWMGPVLGPLAADILTGNLARSAQFGQIFLKAQKAQKIIDTIDEQRQLLSDLKGAYRSEADKLEEYAAGLRETRQELAAQVTSGELSLDDFLEQGVALERLAESYDQVAGQMRNKADTIDERTIIGLVTKNAANVLIGRIKDTVLFEVRNQISSLVKENVIRRLLGGDVDNADLLLDLLVEGDVKEFLDGGGGEGLDMDAFRERLRDQIKQILKEGKQDLKDNWRDKIKEVLVDLADQMKAESEGLPEAPAAGEKQALPVDEHGCRTGYHWDIKVGKCAQTNCNDIPDAHWSYTLDCVCGSSGSVNENPQDPNKECAYSLEYAACPGCVYACVHLDEDCPLEGIGGY